MKIKDRYCLPIIKKSQPEVYETINKNLNKYNYFEIWLDYLDDLNPKILNTLSDYKGSKFVFTLRRRDGVATFTSPRKREAIIKAISKTNHLLDLDITQFNELTAALELKMQNQLILSFHDYVRTPENTYLDKIVKKMRSFNPFILKISTMCKTPSDSLRLMKYKRDFLESGQKHIVLGMGENGTITRVFGALWGNELLYVPGEDAESSASGQLTWAEMDKILKRMVK